MNDCARDIKYSRAGFGPTAWLARVPGIFQHELVAFDRKVKEGKLITVSRRVYQLSSVRLISVAKVKNRHLRLQRLETREEADENDSRYVLKIKRATQALNIAKSRLCSYCRTADCWAACHSSNPFHTVSLALKSQNVLIPQDSYWSNPEIRMMIAAWTSRMWDSFGSRIECTPAADMQSLAHLLLHDIQNVIGRGTGKLNKILFAPGNPLNITEPGVEEVALGLGVLERDFLWVVESQRKPDLWLQPKTRSQSQGSKKRTLAQESVEDVPRKKRRRITATDNSPLVFQNIAKVEEENNREAEERSARISCANQTISIEPPDNHSPRVPDFDLQSSTRRESIAQTPLPFHSSPVVTQLQSSEPAIPPVFQAPSRSTSPRTRLPDSPHRKSQTPVQHPTIEGTNSQTHGELASISQTAAQQLTNGGAISRTYEELARKETPSWAVEYEKGHIAELGLTAGNYNVDFSTPVGKCPAPAKGNAKEIPRVQWLCWQILRQIPGGRMKTKALASTVMEWTKNGVKERTCKQSTTPKKCPSLAQSSDRKNKDSWRFLNDLSNFDSNQAAVEPEQPSLSLASEAEQATTQPQHSSTSTPFQLANGFGYHSFVNQSTPSSDEPTASE